MPMKFTKRLYWRNDITTKAKGKKFANVHLLVGYNQGTLEDFQIMAAELRKTFPQAKDKDLRCTHVTKSRWCDGFTLMCFDAVIEEKDYTAEGWSECDQTQMDYFFS